MVVVVALDVRGGDVRSVDLRGDTAVEGRCLRAAVVVEEMRAELAAALLGSVALGSAADAVGGSAVRQGLEGSKASEVAGESAVREEAEDGEERKSDRMLLLLLLLALEGRESVVESWDEVEVLVGRAAGWLDLGEGVGKGEGDEVEDRNRNMATSYSLRDCVALSCGYAVLWYRTISKQSAAQRQTG